ncbi:MAG: S9 family peptidase [Anaerolineaceae bacterium]|nr:S9 family peptidase [Anaerolineaceae bacterium]
MTQKQTISYGLWPSPVPAIRLEDVLWDQSGALLWLEGHSGHNRIAFRPPDDAPFDLLTDPAPRGRVGYGGGEFTVQDGWVVFAAADGRLYRRRLEYDASRPITPPFGGAAAPKISPDGRWTLYIFSDGRDDCLALADSEGQEWPVQLDRRADFYMQPAWHANGEWIAWIEWDHPNMPWDGSRLKLGKLAGSPPRMSEQTCIAGDEKTPICQPLFSPDGRWLSYIAAAEGDWEKLMLFNLETGRQYTLVSGGEQLLSTPAWVQGMHSYGWSRDSRRIFYLSNFAGRSALWQVTLESRRSEQIDVSPYTWLTQLAVSPLDDQLAMIASSPAIPNRVVRWDGSRLITERRSEYEDIPPAYLPTPQTLTWNAPDGTAVHGLYSPPANPAYRAAGLPPAIVNIHGGPTSQAVMRYNAEAVYFTSRGYAWLEVNYRGSTGYGRSYTQKLEKNWGVMDVEDAAGAARALIAQKLAHQNQLALRGSSAGGFTVLNTLIHHPRLYRCGICLYGVANLFSLAQNTHKFEAHYHETLVGMLPEESTRYAGRSPVFHAAGIRDPLLLFHGSDDRVVPPEQSSQIEAALLQHGVPHVYKQYAGEGHGFRENETILDVLKTTEQFLQNHLLFSPL